MFNGCLRFEPETSPKKADRHDGQWEGRLCSLRLLGRVFFCNLKLVQSLAQAPVNQKKTSQLFSLYWNRAKVLFSSRKFEEWTKKLIFRVFIIFRFLCRSTLGSTSKKLIKATREMLKVYKKWMNVDGCKTHKSCVGCEESSEIRNCKNQSPRELRWELLLNLK